MAFTNSFRIERVYFEKLKSMIDVLKSYKDRVTEEPARTIIENSIDVDGATLLLYRNLGEAWAELADLIAKTQKLLQDLADKTEDYHDELNERIDEVNNYLNRLIIALTDRVDAIEKDLREMGRIYTLELSYYEYVLNPEESKWHLSLDNKYVTFNEIKALFTHNKPHLVTVRGKVNDETTYFFPREYETSNNGIIEWYAFGFVGDEIHEITVTLLPDDSVNVAIETTDFATINSRISTNKTAIDALKERVTELEEKADGGLYEINVKYNDFALEGFSYNMRHDNEIIGFSDITDAVESGLLPVLYYEIESGSKYTLYLGIIGVTETRTTYTFENVVEYGSPVEITHLVFTPTSGDALSIVETPLQGKLIAGDGITIDGRTISKSIDVYARASNAAPVIVNKTVQLNRSTNYMSGSGGLFESPVNIDDIISLMPNNGLSVTLASDRLTQSETLTGGHEIMMRGRFIITLTSTNVSPAVTFEILNSTVFALASRATGASLNDIIRVNYSPVTPVRGIKDILNYFKENYNENGRLYNLNYSLQSVLFYDGKYSGPQSDGNASQELQKLIIQLRSV